jgi:glycine dehydrogenase subunit 1
MRHLPHTDQEKREMLVAVGVKSIEDLFASIPPSMRSSSALSLPAGMNEIELTAHLKTLSEKNRTCDSGPTFLGGGAYRHFVPAAVSELSSRSEFVTPYTPYQPEISQGTLQVLFEYQTMIARLFAMDVSNASHYSGATAFADACLMARRATKKRKIVVPDNMHPEYRAVVKTVLAGEDDIKTLKTKDGVIDRSSLSSSIDDDTAAIAAQYPSFFGTVEEFSDVAEMAHGKGSLFITATPEPIALGILKPPGEFGADIAVGEGLSLGLPVSFGGPTLGIFTTSEKLVRQMPGRICGRTVDAEGRTSYTLTLSTREQHIRREKATSNICSNQALCATTAAIYLSLLGRQGIYELASLNASLCEYAKGLLTSIKGVRIPYGAPTFNEFVIETPLEASDLIARLASRGIAGGIALSRWYKNMGRQLLICTTELSTKDNIEKYAEALASLIK